MKIQLALAGKVEDKSADAWQHLVKPLMLNNVFTKDATFPSMVDNVCFLRTKKRKHVPWATFSNIQAVMKKASATYCEPSFELTLGNHGTPWSLQMLPIAHCSRGFEQMRVRLEAFSREQSFSLTTLNHDLKERNQVKATNSTSASNCLKKQITAHQFPC